MRDMDIYQELFLELPLERPAQTQTSKVEVGEKVDRKDNEFEVDLTIKSYDILI